MAQSKIHLSDLGESETWIRKPMDAIFMPNLISILLINMQGAGYSGEPWDRKSRRRMIANMKWRWLWRKAGGCSPLLLCLSSTVSLMTLISAQVGCNDNALPGLVDVRLIQWYSGAFIVACLSMTGVIGDSDVWHHLGQRWDGNSFHSTPTIITSFAL